MMRMETSDANVPGDMCMTAKPIHANEQDEPVNPVLPVLPDRDEMKTEHGGMESSSLLLSLEKRQFPLIYLK